MRNKEQAQQKQMDQSHDVIPHSYTKQRVSDIGAVENLKNEPSPS